MLEMKNVKMVQRHTLLNIVIPSTCEIKVFVMNVYYIVAIIDTNSLLLRLNLFTQLYISLILLYNNYSNNILPLHQLLPSCLFECENLLYYEECMKKWGCCLHRSFFTIYNKILYYIYAHTQETVNSIYR